MLYHLEVQLFILILLGAASKSGVGNEATHLLTFGCKDDVTSASADPTPFANLNGTGGGVGGTVRGDWN